MIDCSFPPLEVLVFRDRFFFTDSKLRNFSGGFCDRLYKSVLLAAKENLLKKVLVSINILAFFFDLPIQIQ